MKKTLVIVAHPDLGSSKVNKAFFEELKKYENDITTYNIYEKYPNFDIDVKKEQETLVKYDNVILQFPLYWHNLTPLLKKWLDDVLLYGWAYGTNGDKLKGKGFGFTVSTGSGDDKYLGKNEIGETLIDRLLFPYKLIADYVGAKYLKPYTFFGALGATDEKIKDSAKKYIEHIKSL
ncbi:MAG: NAD(P)H-dependent oxidoreductase [Campylobacteraceae bacterium]